MLRDSRPGTPVALEALDQVHEHLVLGADLAAHRVDAAGGREVLVGVGKLRFVVVPPSRTPNLPSAALSGNSDCRGSRRP